jgi:GTP-binding protein
MSTDWKQPTTDITPLLDAILQHIPAPKTPEGSLQMQITSLDYSSYIGRIAIGRIFRNKITSGQMVSLIKRDGAIQKTRIRELYLFEGLAKMKATEALAGDICAIVGLEDFEIGDTVADFENPEALPGIRIDEPTMSMLFTINNSPFFGKEGKFVTSRHLKDRLDKELEKNLALRVEPTPSADAFTVFGRGVLHLSILIETMRREGYELQVGQPQVIIKEINGVKHEPVETLAIDVPEEYVGRVIEMVSRRKGEMKKMEPKGDRIHLEFEMPSRGLIGLRTNMLTSTAGEAVMYHRFKEFQPYKGEIEKRINGSLIVKEPGIAYAYAIDKLQDRGRFFIDPGEAVYAGQVVGENSKSDDLTINVCVAKKLTNVRATGHDDKARMIPPIKFTLEEALEYIQQDEYVEVTPKSIRLRKIYLDENDRKRSEKKLVMV